MKAELKFSVDLGVDKGKPGKERDTFLLILRPAGKVRLEALKAYLGGKQTWDDSVLVCMS